MSEIKVFHPGQERSTTSFSLLDSLGLSEDIENLEFFIKTMENILDLKLSLAQKNLVLSSIQKLLSSEEEITMLDCYEEWYRYSALDNWTANVKRYFLF